MTKINMSNINTGDNNSDWKVLLFSLDSIFNNVFTKAISAIVFERKKVEHIILSNIDDFKNHLIQLEDQSVIHINADGIEESTLEDLVKSIREISSLKFKQLVVWMKTPWELLDLQFVSKYGINDVRSTQELEEKRLIYVIKTNIFNQKNLISLLALNENLENEVAIRTKSLSESNKTLQSYVIKNGNINTKLQQQKDLLNTQRLEAIARNNEIEKAFKKSSKQHIKFHKVLMENEAQRARLEEALEEIQAVNEKLIAQNEEIKSQRDHIEQQREEIQSQRDMALEQNEMIVQHQNEIQDNITYARRIQQALLPPKELISQILPKHFVFNKPKDIVSGDFYWVAQNRNYSVVAVADCTGHGISGAMMSMLATGYLNEIVNKNDITESALILNQLRERIISSLHQNNEVGIENSRDGLDIALCIIDIVDLRLEFSGANNPLYIIRNDELIELKPDKMPIGIHEFSNIPFSTQYFDLMPNDCIYLFSDGYADQFGGKLGKKLKYARFRNMLLEIHNQTRTEQMEQVSNRFMRWKGDYEQVDDVLVMGFRI